MEKSRDLSWSWYQIRQSRDYLRYFDEDFSKKKKDVFFCHLNEIEPSLISNNENKISIDYGAAVMDPRTKKGISNPIVDISKLVSETRIPKIFTVFTQASTLSKREHQSGLEILLHNQEKMKTLSQDLTSNKRIQEMREFNTVVENMLCAQPNRTSKLKEALISQYQQIFQNKAVEIVNRGNQFYSIQSAIPFGIKNENAIEYTQGSIVKQSGHVIEYSPSFYFPNLLKSEESIPEIDNHSILISNQENMELQFAKADIILPEASAILLLNVCPALESWEIAFTITPRDCNSNGSIVFDEPLPLRSGSEFVCIQTLEYMIQRNMQSKADSCCLWLDYGIVKNNTCGTPMDVHAIDLNCDYHLVDYNEYLSKRSSLPSKSIPLKSNEFFRKWTLGTKNSNGNSKEINIITKTSVPCFQFNNGEPTFVNLSLKIENKAEFGAEVMTKGEIIREWLRQYLMCEGFTKRVRLDAHNLKPIATQNLDLNDIETELMRLYNTSPEDLLSPLFSMLNVIQSFPVGDYLLKFNPKFSDKLIVYSKASFNSVNGINLRELYEHVRLKTSSIQSSEYIPIDGNVATFWHKAYNVLPCCFPHWHIDKNFSNKKLDETKTPSKPTKKKKAGAKKCAEDVSSRQKMSKLDAIISDASGEHRLSSKTSEISNRNSKCKNSKKKQRLRDKLTGILKRNSVIY